MHHKTVSLELEARLNFLMNTPYVFRGHGIIAFSYRWLALIFCSKGFSSGIGPQKEENKFILNVFEVVAIIYVKEKLFQVQKM